jgi:hypothetical protein
MQYLNNISSSKSFNRLKKFNNIKLKEENIGYSLLNNKDLYIDTIVNSVTNENVPLNRVIDIMESDFKNAEITINSKIKEKILDILKLFEDDYKKYRDMEKLRKRANKLIIIALSMIFNSPNI